LAQVAVKGVQMSRFGRFGIAALALAALSMVGCHARSTVPFLYPHATKPTRTLAPHEHYQQISDVAEQDQLLLINDLDLVFLTDRPTRLSKWRSR
jgi:hypothetical protein